MQWRSINICMACEWHIRHILSQKDTEKLVHACVTSRLDYFNFLLSGTFDVQLCNFFSQPAIIIYSDLRPIPLLHCLRSHMLKIRWKNIWALMFPPLFSTKWCSWWSGTIISLSVPYYPTRKLSECRVICGHLESPKVEWEAEPSAFKLLCCGIRSQFGFGGQTPSPH